MAAASTYLANKLLDHALGINSFDMPSVYVALNTSDPTAAGDDTEYSGGSYERASGYFESTVDAATTNSDPIIFNALGVTTITHVSIWDDQTAGNMLFFGELNDPITTASGDSLIFAPGDLDLSIS
jgi:hypothetical protein